MTKKIMAVTLSILMIFTMIPGSIYGQEMNFSDMPNDWSTTALKNAVDNGLLEGFDGKIYPKDNLTRAEMATVINRAFGAEKRASLGMYNDVSSTDWFYNEMSKAVQMKTFQGNGNTLRPNDPITREEAFAVIVRALKLEKSNSIPQGFADLNQISSWAAEEIFTLMNEGYVQGSNGEINPKGYITRAEFAQLMDNIIKEYINEPGDYSLETQGNVMINTPGVTLKETIISGDLIIGDGVGEGEVILEDVEVKGRLLVRGGGDNSIIVRGDSNIDSITIAKVNGRVRVYNEDGSEVGDVIIDGHDDVILEGKFNDVYIRSDNITVTFKNATINNIYLEGRNSKIIIEEGTTVEQLTMSGAGTEAKISGVVKRIVTTATATNSKITVTKNGKVLEIEVNGDGIIIDGEGTVGTVYANANNIVVKTLGTKVIASDNAKGVMAGDQAVAPGTTKIVGGSTSTSSSSSGSSGSSGSSDDDNEDDDEEEISPTITAVSTPSAITTTVNQTVSLPDDVEVTYTDNTTGSVVITEWIAVTTDSAITLNGTTQGAFDFKSTTTGSFELEGSIEGTNMKAIQKVIVKESITEVSTASAITVTTTDGAITVNLPVEVELTYSDSTTDSAMITEWVDVTTDAAITSTSVEAFEFTSTTNGVFTLEGTIEGYTDETVYLEIDIDGLDVDVTVKVDLYLKKN